jgi:hypothetical protein
MAFFTVEDSGGTVECLAFPKTLTQYGEIIKTDNAVFVEGNLSVREDESPKILVSAMAALVDNEHFNGMTTPKAETAPKVQNPSQARDKNLQPGAQEPVAPRATGERPQASGGGYNPYETMPPSRAYNPYEAMPAAVTPPRQASAGPAPRPSSAAPIAPPQKLYLRVPDREGEAYKKALNLCEIFCEGNTVVIFYDISDGKYYASTLKVRATPFVLERLKRVLGEENVVGK